MARAQTPAEIQRSAAPDIFQTLGYSHQRSTNIDHAGGSTGDSAWTLDLAKSSLFWNPTFQDHHPTSRWPTPSRQDQKEESGSSEVPWRDNQTSGYQPWLVLSFLFFSQGRVIRPYKGISLMHCSWVLVKQKHLRVSCIKFAEPVSWWVSRQGWAANPFGRLQTENVKLKSVLWPHRAR